MSAGTTLGATATCRTCGREITYTGDAWSDGVRTQPTVCYSALSYPHTPAEEAAKTAPEWAAAGLAHLQEADDLVRRVWASLRPGGTPMSDADREDTLHLVTGANALAATCLREAQRLTRGENL